MKRKLKAQALILPLLLAFLMILPLLSAAVIGEHRYAISHPSYMRHFWIELLGETTADEDFFGEASPLPVALMAEQERDVRHILVVGRDRVAGLTDVMMIATLDSDAHTLRLLQIPRDTYAAYTTADYKKINGAYAKLGGEGLKAFLSDNLGIAIDNYVCVDLSVLGEMVDQMGGVKMNVPADMDYDDPAQNLHIHLKAGEQVLNGEMAQMFVRFRSGYALADVGRMDAQKLFLSALAKGAKENLSASQTLSLVAGCFGKIKTDMKLSDCLSAARALRQVELSEMHMATLPGSTARSGKGGAWYYILNREAVCSLLEKTAGGAVNFDPNTVFTNPKKPAFDSIYRASADSCQVREYTAEGTLGGDVSIRRVS